MAWLWAIGVWICAIQSVCANTEKVVFRADQPTAAISGFTTITPDDIGVGRLVDSIAFPLPLNGSQMRHYLLQGLTTHWKYEFRICWPASTPTRFDLEIVDPSTIATKDMIEQRSSSQVLIRVTATPDIVPFRELDAFVTTFELILDPLLFGVLPRTIVYPAILIVVVALFAVRVLQPMLMDVIHHTIHGRRQKIVRIKTH